MAEFKFSLNPIWRQYRQLDYQQRLRVFDDALMHRQRLEAMDWFPVIESFDEYQIRVWSELEL